jgi:hypothetical protein
VKFVSKQTFIKMNSETTESTKEKLPGKARDGLEEAVRKFRTNLAGSPASPDVSEQAKQPAPPPPLYNSNLMNQYLKGVLENIETGRKAVQEKVKFVIPTAFATFTITSALASMAHEKFSGDLIGVLLIAIAAAINVCGFFLARILNRVMVATYRFYVSSAIHAKIVFDAVGLHHNWTGYVDLAVRLLDNEYGAENSEEIRDRWRKKRWWGINILEIGGQEEEQDDVHKQHWSNRVMEQWQAQPENLLNQYQKVLALIAIGHFLLALGFSIWTWHSYSLYKAPKPPAATDAVAAGVNAVSSGVIKLRSDIDVLEANYRNYFRQLSEITSNFHEVNQRALSLQSNIAANPLVPLDSTKAPRP